jgi:hypothetical protein
MIKTGAGLRFPTAPSARKPFFCQTLCFAGNKLQAINSTSKRKYKKIKKCRHDHNLWRAIYFSRNSIEGYPVCGVFFRNSSS